MGKLHRNIWKTSYIQYNNLLSYLLRHVPHINLFWPLASLFLIFPIPSFGFRGSCRFGCDSSSYPTIHLCITCSCSPIVIISASPTTNDRCRATLLNNLALCHHKPPIPSRFSKYGTSSNHAYVFAAEPSQKLLITRCVLA